MPQSSLPLYWQCSWNSYKTSNDCRTFSLLVPICLLIIQSPLILATSDGDIETTTTKWETSQGRIVDLSLFRGDVVQIFLIIFLVLWVVLVVSMVVVLACNHRKNAWSWVWLQLGQSTHLTFDKRKKFPLLETDIIFKKIWNDMHFLTHQWLVTNIFNQDQFGVINWKNVEYHSNTTYVVTFYVIT